MNPRMKKAVNGTFPVCKMIFCIKCIKSFEEAFMRRILKILFKPKVLYVKPYYILLYTSIHIGPRSYASVQYSSQIFAGLSLVGLICPRIVHPIAGPKIAW